MQDKFVRDFLLLNLVKDERGWFVWKFNLNAIRTMLERNYINLFECNPSQQFTNPALFIYGGKSNYMKESDFGRVRSLFPNCSFTKIEDAGHYLHVQKQSEFLAALNPFLMD